MNYKQLTIAREFRGLSQTELAKEIKGLSQSSLSKFEKGLSVISNTVQDEIIDYLGFPREFYDIEIHNVLESSHYRKKSVVSKSELTHFELRCKFIGYLVDEMADSLEWPDFLLEPLNVDDGFSPKKIAQYTRKLLSLKSSDPVKNIFSLLESHGVIVYELAAIDKFDGISFFTEKGYPVIIVNKSFSNDRKRFTLAHELGHILMHDEKNFPISEYRTDKIKEEEANIFASEFLMPESEIKNQLHGLMLKDLSTLKKHWFTSMASIVRRAHDLKCIDQNRYKYFLIEFSRLGYRKNEPIEVFIDNPKMFMTAFNLYKTDLDYSDNDFVKVFRMPKELLNELFEVKKEAKIRVLNRLPEMV